MEAHGDSSPAPAHDRRVRVRTWLWSAAYLLQELAVPMAGTANHSVRTLAPFLLASHPACLVLAACAALAVALMHGLRLHSNLLISLTVLVMPFALLGTRHIRLDIVRFNRNVIATLFAACAVQALLPGPSNRMFAPFVDGYLRFEQPFERATGLSMEPSFAAETLFAALMLHVFFTPRLRDGTTLLAGGALLLIRAGTSLQQALLFALVYLFVRCVRPACGARPAPLPALLAGTWALCAMVFGYSLLTYGRLDLSFVRDSIDRFNSWRTVSNVASLVGARPFAFFPNDSNEGWAAVISAGLRAQGLSGDGWVTQPFSAIGVALLDLGVGGAALWIALVYAAALRRLRPHALDPVQTAALYTLLANAIFLAPKWQLSGFLAIGLIASAVEAGGAFRRST